jgi:hypothetical protein
MKALGRREETLLLILDLSTRWDEWLAPLPIRALTSGKGPPLPIGQEAGWAPDPSGHRGYWKNPFAYAGKRTPIARSSIP